MPLKKRDFKKTRTAIKVKLSSVCDKCGKKGESEREGEWVVYKNLDCSCGGRQQLQLDKQSEKETAEMRGIYL